MKLKLSILAGALALAAAGQASAQVVPTDLILSVWDTNTNVSYTLDTGVSMTSFTSAITGTATALSVGTPTLASGTSFGPSANMTSFLAGISSADYAAGDVMWNVTADRTGTLSKGFNLATGAQLLTTSNDSNVTAGVLSNTTLTTGAAPGALNYYSAALNDATTTGAAAAGYAGNGKTFDQYLAQGSGSMFNTAQTLTGSGNSSQGFFFVTTSSKTGVAAADVAEFAGTMNLSSNGSLSYTVAAVPEPSEWLLMLSGFGLVGFIAARRKMQGGMTTTIA
jgi:hypothetical protein